jgi:putative endonuclease
MHFVYFLRSLSRPSKTYVGMTEDIDSRLDAHNSGAVPSTSRFRPWSLISYVAVQTQAQAAELELYFKTGSGHAFWHKRFMP